jgi:hypothetical protein
MKSLFLSLLALVALVASPDTAAAQGGGGGTPGKMRAHGHGSAHFQGAGKFEFRLDKKGVLVVEDAANLQIKIVGIGQSKINAQGDLVVMNFKGKVSVGGQSVKGKFLKGRLRMKATGTGAANFVGKGKIAVNGAPAGNWGPPPGTAVNW